MSFKQHLEQMSFDDLVPLWNEWCDEQPSFAEWLEDNVGDGRLRELWEKFCPYDEGDEIDVGAIADALDGTSHGLYRQWYNEAH